MSSQANDRHVIWGDINLNFDDWKDDLMEQYPDLSEDELIQKMHEINADYLRCKHSKRYGFYLRQ